jgi:hypothetical protein
MTGALFGLTLVLGAWTGADLPGAVVSTVKYRLTVGGPPGAHVVLRSGPLPKRWIGAFCTDRVCAPTQTSVVLPARGVKVVEFQVVPDDERGLVHRHLTVRVEAHAGAARASAATRLDRN